MFASQIDYVTRLLKFIFFIGLFLASCSSFEAIAQDSLSIRGYEVNLHRGYLLTHRQTMRHLPERPATALEFRYIVQTTGSRAWHKYYRMPIYGISLRAFDLGNTQMLGYGFGFSAFLSLPVIQTKRFSSHFEIGWGPGIVTQPYDEDDNRLNPSIGSHLNFFPFMSQKVSYRISDLLVMNGSVSFNHFSNAHLNLPNTGINYPMLGVGVAYLPKNQSPLPDTHQYVKRKGRWALSLAGSIKENTSKRDVKHPIGVLRVERIMGISGKSEVGIGIDAMYNSARISSLEENGDTLNSALQNTQLGISANYHLVIEKITLLVGGGLFLYTAYPDFRNYYNRAGMRYDFAPGWALNMTIKTYIFRADYFELGMSKYF